LVGAGCKDLEGVGSGSGSNYLSCKASQEELQKDFDVNMESKVRDIGNLFNNITYFEI